MSNITQFPFQSNPKNVENILLAALDDAFKINAAEIAGQDRRKRINVIEELAARVLVRLDTNEKDSPDLKNCAEAYLDRAMDNAMKNMGRRDGDVQDKWIADIHAMVDCLVDIVTDKQGAATNILILKEDNKMGEVVTFPGFRKTDDHKISYKDIFAKAVEPLLLGNDIMTLVQKPYAEKQSLVDEYTDRMKAAFPFGDKHVEALGRTFSSAMLKALDTAEQAFQKQHPVHSIRKRWKEDIETSVQEVTLLVSQSAPYLKR